MEKQEAEERTKKIRAREKGEEEAWGEEVDGREGTEEKERYTEEENRSLLLAPPQRMPGSVPLPWEGVPIICGRNFILTQWNEWAMQSWPLPLMRSNSRELSVHVYTFKEQSTVAVKTIHFSLLYVQIRTTNILDSKTSEQKFYIS